MGKQETIAPIVRHLELKTGLDFNMYVAGNILGENFQTWP